MAPSPVSPHPGTTPGSVKGITGTKRIVRAPRRCPAFPSPRPDVCSVTAKELELAALGGASNQAAEPGHGPEVVDAVQGKRTLGVAGL